MKKKMTYEEAKNLIDDITWKYNGNSITNEAICKCRDKCREALDKQIPKKVVLKINQIGQGVRGVACFTKCPCCRQVILKENNMCFCNYCGQALDWSDEI